MINSYRWSIGVLIASTQIKVVCSPGRVARNMAERFQDLLLRKIPDCVINPFLGVGSRETGEAEE